MLNGACFVPVGMIGGVVIGLTWFLTGSVLWSVIAGLAALFVSGRYFYQLLKKK